MLPRQSNAAAAVSMARRCTHDKVLGEKCLVSQRMFHCAKSSSGSEPRAKPTITAAPAMGDPANVALPNTAHSNPQGSNGVARPSNAPRSAGGKASARRVTAAKHALAQGMRSTPRSPTSASMSSAPARTKETQAVGVLKREAPSTAPMPPRTTPSDPYEVARPTWYQQEPIALLCSATASGPHMHAQCTELAAPKTKLSTKPVITHHVECLTVVSATEHPSRRQISSADATKGKCDPQRCTHCGLVVPGERRSSQFCCAGCEAVYELLAGEGLLRFYDMGGREAGAVGGVPQVPVADWFEELASQGTSGDLVRVTLDVQGIRCAACVWLLQTVWKRLPGAVALQLDASLGRATLVWRAEHDTGKQFFCKAARLGYLLAPQSRRIERDTGLLLRLGISAAVAMNSMLLAVSLYFGLDQVWDDESQWLRSLFGWLLAALGTISVVVGGPEFFRGAIRGLQARVVHMDLPIALGLSLAYGGSVYGQLTGGPTYFDTVSIFIALMLGGRFLQQRTLARSREQILADDGVAHLRARRVEEAGVQVVPVAALRVGDELLLAPGDLVPVTVRLLAGPASLSLDWINGESEPRVFAAGAQVPAGAFFAGRTALRAMVLASCEDSGLRELLGREPLDREDTRGQVRFWERLNRGYAVGVLVIAAALGALWWWLDASRAMSVVVSVLVITCPCALGIATPLAFHLALAQLRTRGVFVRTRSLLDKLRHVRSVVFDKTGTVTFGGLRATVDRDLPTACLPVLATLAGSSNHPVAQAVARALPKARFQSDLVVTEWPGQGLETQHDGATYRLGSARFAGLVPSPNGARECVLARDGSELARFAIEEDYRAGADAEVAALRARGLRVHLFSGDRVERVVVAAQVLGIEPDAARGEMSPQAKAQALLELGATRTLMVGDGLNDAPAFAAAYCAGTPAMDRPVLPTRADFCFRGAQSGSVQALFEVADLHRRVVRANLTMALVYNAYALVLCAFAAMTPVLSAISMPISSLLLVSHTAWRFRRPRSMA